MTPTQNVQQLHKTQEGHHLSFQSSKKEITNLLLIHYPLRAGGRLLSSDISEFGPQHVGNIDDMRHACNGTVV